MKKIKNSAKTHTARTKPTIRTVSSAPPPGGRAARSAPGAGSGASGTAPGAPGASEAQGASSTAELPRVDAARAIPLAMAPHENAVLDDAAASYENAAGNIPEDRVRRCIEAYRISRAHDGVYAADIAFFTPLIRQWGLMLRPSAPAVDRGSLSRAEFLLHVAVGMHESMGLRDALILSVISQLKLADLIEAAVNPTQPGTAQLVSSTLSAVFRDPAQTPDSVVCGHCLDALVEIHSRVPLPYCAQPLAVMAYLLWWSGRDGEASGAALRALSIDGECTLASIVLSATEYGISPAWRVGR